MNDPPLRPNRKGFEYNPVIGVFLSHGCSAKLLLPRVVGGEVEDKTKRHIEWVVKTKRATPTSVTIVARCPRAGVDRKQVSLE